MKRAGMQDDEKCIENVEMLENTKRRINYPCQIHQVACICSKKDNDFSEG